MYKKLQSLENVKTFRFVDPYNVGYVPNNKADNTSIKKGIESRASSLAQALSGTLTNQVALVPCNVGNHWILTIIDPHNKEIGLLDPLYKGIHIEDWRQVVELALNVHASGKRTIERKGNLWTVFQIPKQQDFVQCGFYVMKFIKKIVEVASDNSIHSLQKMFDKKPPYSIADIDEVRKEWAKFVQSNKE